MGELLSGRDGKNAKHDSDSISFSILRILRLVPWNNELGSKGDRRMHLYKNENVLQSFLLHRGPSQYTSSSGTGSLSLQCSLRNTFQLVNRFTLKWLLNQKLH